MPVHPTYPGVYIQEVPSGTHTITGVSTSVTAFIGRALRGPTDQPVTINSFADFQRQFGGLWKESLLGYAVRDFFINGGSQAIIVRVFKDISTAASPIGAPLNLMAKQSGPTGNGIKFSIAITATEESASSSTPLDLKARYPGTPGNNIKYSIINNSKAASTSSPLNLTAKKPGASGNEIKYSITAGADSTKFNLSITDTGAPFNSSNSESFIDVTIANFSQKISDSNLVTPGTAPTAVPTATATDIFLQGGVDKPFDLTVTDTGVKPNYAEFFPNITVENFSEKLKTSVLVIPGNGTPTLASTDHPIPLENGTDTKFTLIVTDTGVTPNKIEAFADLTIATVQNIVNNGSTGNTLASSLVKVVSAPTIPPATDVNDVFLTNNPGPAFSSVCAIAPAALGLNLIAQYAGLLSNNINCLVTNSDTKTKFDLKITNGITRETYSGLTLTNISSKLRGSKLVTLASIPTAIPDNTNSYIKFSNGIEASTSDSIFKTANAGIWGNQLQVSVNYDVSEDVAANYGLLLTDLFNLIITDKSTGAVEQFNNVSIKDSPGEIDQVLSHQSKLMSINKNTLTERPLNTTYFFEGSNDGSILESTNVLGEQNSKTGLYALENVSIFNLLCIPGYNTTSDVDDGVLTAATAYCVDRKAFFIIDAPSTWKDKDTAKTSVNDLIGNIGSAYAKNAAVFFPRIVQPDPLSNNQLRTFVPCGMIAGTMARIDGQRGIWKAPAGLETGLAGVTQLTVSLTDAENGELNPVAVNCLRTMPAAGTVVWGSRTLQGNDLLASDWKYIPVRRFTLYIEQSAYLGTQWAVFEPNDEPLWRQLRLNLNSFMNTLFRQGAFQGQKASDAYFVKCDSETTTQADIDNGIVNIQIGFAPLKPAEFVIINIQQVAGQSS